MPSWPFAAVQSQIASLSPIEDIWQRLPDTDAIDQLRRREQLLGVATLSAGAFELVHEIVSARGIHNSIIRHPPSVKAMTKQALLAGIFGGVNLWVNKTTTVRLGPQYFLCTGTGDFPVSRRLLRHVADELGLPARVVKACRINPPEYSPESELGLLAGMVSPFLSPAAPRQRLRAVVLCAEPEFDATEQHSVAISLSPFESLVVARADFHELTRLYAERAYPDLCWTQIRY